jgi:hypothetical protein
VDRHAESGNPNICYSLSGEPKEEKDLSRANVVRKVKGMESILCVPPRMSSTLLRTSA